MNFDNVFEKAKEAFESAYKKTEDVVNVQKQKFDVSSLESKLAKSYEILGKVCYDAVSKGEAFDPESAKPVIDDIVEKTKAIEEMKKEILKAQNKRICENCGALIERNAAFCSSCGVKTGETKAPKSEEEQKESADEAAEQL